MKINEDEAHLRVEIGSGGQMTAQIEPKRKIDVLIGDAAKMDCQRAINYIKSGTAEIDKAVEDGIEDFNENATEKTTAYNENAAEKLLAYNTNDEQKTLAYNENAQDKFDAYNLNASDKLSAFDNNATSKTSAFNDNYTAKLGDFNDNATDKTNTFNQNATDKTGDFNDNASDKTQDFNDNYSDKLSAFDANATDKTDAFNTNATNKTNAFNDNATSKTTSFNENAAIKQAAVDASAANAAISETNAANSATSASNSAGLAKQWAIGDPTEPTGNSAKYWANQASSELSGLTSRVSTIEGKIPSDASASNQLADKSYVNTADSGLQSQIDTKQNVISDLATIRAGAALGATSVQSVTTGTTNGTIKVDGSDVSVYGLGSAAYTASTAYDASGSASTAETNAKNYADSLASNYATAAQGAKADTAVQPADLATVATTGDYDDLSNKPTIPAAQVNSDWNANSGVAQILNKPSLAAVATSGAYADLSGTPTIPTVNDATLTIQKNGANVATFTANSATNATANITVPTDTADLTNGAGFITGITSSNVTTALGYTPYNSTNPSGYQTAADVASAISGKQDTLVSGTNIKTINGSSVLGSGDLTISATASFASITGDPGDNENLVEWFDAKANTDLSNLDETGKSYGAELSMPSDNYINLTVPSSGSFYTAPANGYVSMYVLTNGSGAITLDNVDIQANIGSVVWTAGTNGLSTYVPVKKGQAVRIGYVSISQFLSFKFIYAEGEI